MKKIWIGFSYLLCTFLVAAQTPLDAPLPEKFKGLKEIVLVDNFPNPVKATTYDSEPNKFFWKHTTTLLSLTENIT